jgi:hypothetical protein
MFVRFRQTRATLQLSLVETRRENGRICHDHIAGLGSVPDPASIADRIKFWADLNDRLAKLGNRLGPDVSKVMGMIHDRVPMPTEEEQRELQLENARADERLYSGLAEWHAETAASQNALAASAQRVSADSEAAAAANASSAAEAHDRAERIERGEALSGGLGKPIGYEEMRAILKKAGFTADHLRHVERTGEVYRTLKEIFDGDEDKVDEIVVRGQTEARRKAAERAGRAYIRRVARNLDALLDNAKAKADDDQDDGSEPDLP